MNIRATELQTFEECPQSYFAMRKRKDSGEIVPQNKYAKIGTDIHSIIEQVIANNLYYETETIKGLLDLVDCTLDQKFKTLSYIHRLDYLENEEKVLEFTMEHAPLQGTTDVIVIRDGELEIIDHKTIRKPSSSTYWKRKIQPQVYSVLAYAHFSGMGMDIQKINFRLGHAFLNTIYDFSYTIEEIELNLSHIQELLKQMEYYQHYEIDKRTPNDNCRYCLLQDSCSLFNYKSSDALMNTIRFAGTGNTSKISMYEEGIEKMKEEIERLKAKA